jgi:hypothetical protein
MTGNEYAFRVLATLLLILVFGWLGSMIIEAVVL